MSKRLSVIIPGYNTAKNLWQRCVCSVQTALGPEDEIIVVDDGSNAPVEPEWFVGNVKVLRRENGGLSRARNMALEVAEGEYVTFVDSDDEVRPVAFSRCLDALITSQSDICIYGVEVFWTKEGLQKQDVPWNRVYGRLAPRDVANLSKRCLLNYACNKVYRKSFLKMQGLEFDPDGMPCEDIIFNLECIMAGAKWCSVDSIGYVYYRVSGGRTILTSYRPTNYKGLQLGAGAWARYCATLTPQEAAQFLPRAHLTEQQRMALEWKNIWMPGSPFSLVGRWRWLAGEGLGVQELRGFRSLGRVKVFVKTLVFTFLRRHFYLRPIRRWHIRRMYPYVTEVTV